VVEVFRLSVFTDFEDLRLVACDYWGLVPRKYQLSDADKLDWDYGLYYIDAN